MRKIWNMFKAIIRNAIELFCRTRIGNNIVYDLQNKGVVHGLYVVDEDEFYK